MNKLFGGILLVSGTTIGAAMLAMPISTGMAGFLPSLILMIASWLFMTFTALLILEVNLWMKGDVNLMTMARLTLGRWGEWFSWATYLFLLYALTTAYIAASGPIFIELMRWISGAAHIPAWMGGLPLLSIFGFFVYKGTRAVDYVNRVLMIGLVIAYGLLVIFVLPHVDVTMLAYSNPYVLPVATSVVITSFGFHIIIPTLTTYMKGDLRQLRLAILIGSFIPLVIYVVWQVLTLGVVPLTGDVSILSAYQAGTNSATLLAEILNFPTINIVARGLLFFAIITSFLGVSLSLKDFLADGLKIERTRFGRILLCVLTFVPPLLISLTYPRAFLTALEYAGAYGVVTLLCLLPALMVWRGRYHLNMPWHYRAPGGKIALVAVIIISLIIIGFEAGINLGNL